MIDRNNIAEKWQQYLRAGGNEHHLSRRSECKKIRKFSRMWRRIFKYLILTQGINLSAFDVGCGGCKHLVSFALNGWRSVGIDCSREVLERADNYVAEISKLCGKIDVELVCGDFLEYKANGAGFDLVYHVGVLEHFLDKSERLAALKKMFDLAKPGGYIVSIVPSGVHPLREKMKKLGLGGYNIPEIDYSPSLMKEEFEKFGAREIKVMPHNIFGYLLIDKDGKIVKLLKTVFYYAVQLIPVELFLHDFAIRHGSALIGIAKKR